MALPTYWDYDAYQDIWPDGPSRPLVPVRVGVNAKTGKIMVGWRHVEQSIGKIYSTPYHERILRQWVGSFVPYILGKNTTSTTVTRFFWAMAVALDLWEPCYRIRRIRIQSRAEKASKSQRSPDQNILTSADEVRKGQLTFMNEGLYMPRGHLGDMTPEDQRIGAFAGSAAGFWERVET